jgi:putative radical SAM enzyme (TIGR03279 family)
MPAGLIAAVAPGSLAERAGLQPGDELLAINGHRLRDALDVQFYAAEEHLALRVRRNGQEYTVEAERQYGEPLGLEFARPTFDGLRRCNNRCEFCFVAQMAPGLRRSLYVRDDDYRHSFLFGNYVTLTNLDEADWERIGEQHLSPLYVSVHATDPGLRRRILSNPAAPDVLAQLRRLAGMGIETHTQIVVVPGLNDGPHLDRSLGDLSGSYPLHPLTHPFIRSYPLTHPLTRSVSVVPVGLTKYHRGDCRVHTDAERRAVFDLVAGWQARLRARLGVHFAYLSDEWYLRLGEEVPPLEAYDGLDLTENGVGLVRRFLENGEFANLRIYEWTNGRMANGEWRLESGDSNFQLPTAATLVTGTLFAPVLQRVTADVPGVEVVPVVNRFFGETVTVAGLLTGRDVVAQLRERELGDVVVLPAAMFGGPAGQSLDEMGPQDIEKALGRPVKTSGRGTTR